MRSPEVRETKQHTSAEGAQSGTSNPLDEQPARRLQFEDSRLDREMTIPDHSIGSQLCSIAARQPILTVSAVSGLAALIGSGVFGARALYRRRTESPTSAAVRRLKDGLHELSSFLEGTKESAAHAGSEAGSQIKSSARAAGRRMENVGHSLHDAAEHGLHRAADTIEHRPLLSGLTVVGVVLAVGALAASSRRNSGFSLGGRSYEDQTYQELYRQAQKRDIEGRSGMSKKELIKALRTH